MSSSGNTRRWVPRAATALAILSCYGTTLLIGLLSLLGITLPVNERLWASAIAAFALLAVITIAISARQHRSMGPTAIAVVGAGLIWWAMFGSYNRFIEIAGFGLLIAATLWDWRAGLKGRAATDPIAWMEPEALADRLGRPPKPVVVDVRGPEEFTGPLGHVANALNLPMGEIAQRMTEIGAFKHRPVVLVCRTDRRSASSAELLRRAGFRDVHVLRGGMERWNALGFAIGREVPSAATGTIKETRP